MIALNRLIVQLFLNGDVAIARSLSQEVERTVFRLPTLEAGVKAWIDVGKAAVAANSDEIDQYLQLLESAVAGFVEARDARNACLQRTNIGNAYLQLGCYEEAERYLRDALVVGEPMQLHFIGPVQANLGFTIARRGRLDEALEVESAALALCVKLGHRRSDAASRIYLAEIDRLRDELADAGEQARRGVEAATTPSLRAYALATLAHVQLARGHSDEALALARQAMTMLQSLEGVEEGESLIGSSTSWRRSPPATRPSPLITPARRSGA